MIDETLQFFTNKPTFPVASCHQVHGCVCRVASLEDRSIADGLVTNQKELPLLIRHADCQPTLLVDPVRCVLALVHAGWRGLVQNIYGKMCQTMVRLYQTELQNVVAYIGPSLCPKHAEFIHYKKEFPPSFWPFQTTHNHFDLKTIGAHQLKEAGVLQVETSAYCTLCDPRFASYRRNQTTRRNYFVAKLTDKKNTLFSCEVFLDLP